MRNDIDQTLREVFGFDSFRPLQREIIEGLINGEDAFVLMRSATRSRPSTGRGWRSWSRP